MTHRKWTPGALMAKAYRDITEEHNATVDALEAALAPIRVPFSDAQIEKMAMAARIELKIDADWDWLSSDRRDEWINAIRAALAAGGLEPCAVPDYAPEDVAFSSKRASVVELREIGVDAYLSHDTAKRENAGCMVDPMQAATIAVRSRVEAPLLAEIRHLRSKLASAHQKTERQAAELTKLYHLRQGDAGERARLEQELATERDKANRFDATAQGLSEIVDGQKRDKDTLRAELEAVKAERDEMCHQQTKRCMSWRRCFNLAFRLKNKYRAELAALRQPVDVPSVEECSKLAQASLRDAQLSGLGNGEQIYVVARDVRDAVLAGVGAQPTATPTDAQVEALARVLDTAYEIEAGGHTMWRDQSPYHQDRRCAQARAAYAHIGRVPVGWELNVTADVIEVIARSSSRQTRAKEILDLCRSRIKPIYECKECAKVKAERDAFCRSWDDCRNRLCVIRNLCDQAALNEGSES